MAQTLTETLDGNGAQRLPFAHGTKVAIVSLTIDGLEIPSLNDKKGWRFGYLLTPTELRLRGYLFTQNPQNVVVTYTVAAPPRNECNCGSPTTGKWANIHSSHCAVNNLINDLEARIHAIAVKHCIALPEPVVREMVSYLLKGLGQ